jgi:hypothetical protein
VTEDPATLHVEIVRLRDLLEDNGIDPDPAPPEPEQYGPPTELEWRMCRLMEAATRGLLKQYVERASDIAFYEGPQWTAEQTARMLRVRVPATFNVVRHV